MANDETTGFNDRWPVDLTREEFLGYQKLLGRSTGFMQGKTLQIVLSTVLCVYLLVLFGYLAIRQQEYDFLLLAAAVVTAAVDLVFWFVLPARRRRAAIALYDENVAAGYSYYGMLQVFPDRVEKAGDEMTTAIPTTPDSLFIESPEYMVWLNREQRAIVLPARCMTAEAAAAVRAAADRLPPRNRRFFGRLQPRGEQPLPPKKVPLTVLWEQTIDYTGEEYTALLRSTTMNNYRRQLPMLSFNSLLIALLITFTGGPVWAAIPWFLGLFLLMTVFSLWLPLRRCTTAETVPPQIRRLWVSLSDRGVRVRSGARFAVFPWQAVGHVIDRGTYVEILREPQSVWIPKRCIDDLAAFDAMIRQYWKNKK